MSTSGWNIEEYIEEYRGRGGRCQQAGGWCQCWDASRRPRYSGDMSMLGYADVGRRYVDVGKRGCRTSVCLRIAPFLSFDRSRTIWISINTKLSISIWHQGQGWKQAINIRSTIPTSVWLCVLAFSWKRWSVGGLCIVTGWTSHQDIQYFWANYRQKRKISSGEIYST